MPDFFVDSFNLSSDLSTWSFNIDCFIFLVLLMGITSRRSSLIGLLLELIKVLSCINNLLLGFFVCIGLFLNCTSYFSMCINLKQCVSFKGFLGVLNLSNVVQVRLFKASEDLHQLLRVTVKNVFSVIIIWNIY